MEDNIYNMKLHESIWLDDHHVIRVAGGWIYTDRRGENAMGTFVPYNDEFKA